MAVERTLLFFKPDLAGSEREGEARIDLFKRVRRNELEILRSRQILTPPLEILKKHYAEHEGKHFYKDLLAYIGKGPIKLFVVEGEDAVAKCRELSGKTDGRMDREAGVDSFRAKWGVDGSVNAIHASADAESAERELKIWSAFINGGEQ